MIEKFNARLGKSIVAVDDEVKRILDAHAWPGNVRELHNVIERAAIVAAGPEIEVHDLPPAMRGTPENGRPGPGLTPGMTVEEASRRLIVLTLEHASGNKTRAADMLGISLKTLHNKLNRFRAQERGDST
jgi:DNA-binding NtrC family response regulator